MKERNMGQNRQNVKMRGINLIEEIMSLKNDNCDIHLNEFKLCMFI